MWLSYHLGSKYKFVWYETYESQIYSFIRSMTFRTLVSPINIHVVHQPPMLGSSQYIYIFTLQNCCCVKFVEHFLLELHSE